VTSRAAPPIESQIESMTGYGESHLRLGRPTLVCRVRSLNHRHLDVKVRLPRPDLAALDLAIRKRVAELFKRGAVDVNVSIDATHESTSLELNLKTVESYARQAKALGAKLKKLKIPATGLSLDGLLRLPGVFEASAGIAENAFDGKQDGEILSKLVEPALAALKTARRAEGGKLRTIILAHLGEMLTHVGAITALEQPEKERARAQMIERAKETLQLLDTARGSPSEDFLGRLREEAVFWIERRDFAEERARLEMHLTDMNRQLSDEPSGRKLEFLVQEIQREINTLGTKAQAPSITTHTIELKAILERIREQLANVE